MVFPLLLSTTNNQTKTVKYLDVQHIYITCIYDMKTLIKKLHATTINKEKWIMNNFDAVKSP